MVIASAHRSDELRGVRGQDADLRRGAGLDEPDEIADVVLAGGIA